jgi:hypothetical protein
MTFSTILTLVLGILLLLFGRRLFWLFVAVAGFIAGLTFATMYMHGQPELVILLIAIVAGVIGAFLGVILEGLAILIAGFLAGGYLATALLVSLGLSQMAGYWFVYVMGGVIGLILVAALFDWAIIILSVLVGAEIIMTFLAIPNPAHWLVLLGLIIVGLLVQVGVWHRRYPAERTWFGRRQQA